MNSTQPQKLSDGAEQWFENGTKAMSRYDWTYGLECLSKAVQLQPDELEYRKQRHRCCRRKFKMTGQVSRIDSVKVAAIRSRLLTAQVRDDWVAIDHLAESALAIDPWDAQMFANVGEAAIRLGRMALAKYAYTAAVKIKRDNPAYLRALGGVLQSNGEYDEAKACFAQLQASDTGSRVAEELIRAVDVASMINQQEYLHAENARDVQIAVDNKPAAEPAAEVSEQQPAKRRKLPESKLVAYLTLAEDHVQKGQLATALEGYKHALELAPGNASIRVRMEDVELAFLRGRAMDAQTGVKQNPTCERRRAVATELLTDLTSRELQILSQRVAEHPDDLLQAFRLADLYRRASQPTEAIPLFQKVCASPDLKIEAMIGLGECLVRANQAEAGRKQLEEALQSIVCAEKPSAFKIAHYWLGRIYEHRAENSSAVEHYAEIIAVDFQFRDVARRLEAINSNATAS